MANGSTQFDVTFYRLQAGQHDTAATSIATKLQQAAAEGGWKIEWMLTTTEGILLVLQRPTPAAKPKGGSLAGYGVVPDRGSLASV
jgi:hypothetical protein